MNTDTLWFEVVVRKECRLADIDENFYKLPPDAYNPRLHVVKRFEFSRPRGGKVHFRYSQRAEAEERPATVSDANVSEFYVSRACSYWRRDVEVKDISKVRLVRWEHGIRTFEFVREGAHGEDEVVRQDDVYWHAANMQQDAHRFRETLLLEYRTSARAYEYSV